MGYGAFMKVLNTRGSDIQSFVINVNCMYDNGDEGSNLSLFDNAKVPGGETLPDDSGHGQYIEAKGSGGCWGTDSTFSVKIEDAGTAAIIGQVDFTDSSHNWNYSTTNPDVIDVYVNNADQQAIIRITVEDAD